MTSKLNSFNIHQHRNNASKSRESIVMSCKSRSQLSSESGEEDRIIRGGETAMFLRGSIDHDCLVPNAQPLAVSRRSISGGCDTRVFYQAGSSGISACGSQHPLSPVFSTGMRDTSGIASLAPVERKWERYRPWRQSLVSYAVRVGQRIVALLEGKKANAEGTEVERTVVRYMPESIDKLLSITGFDKNELKTLYRNFKNECPTGVVNEEKFKSIYCQFFPNGDADMYAHHVFRAFDQQEEGYVNFEEFAIGLSSLLRGSLADRLHWTFRLYDINHDGFITKEEMIDILKSIYLMLGKFVDPAVTEESYIVHAEKIFTQLDLNQDGIVTMDEFCETCAKDESIIHSMSIFDKAM
uniref:Calsenilin n=1 Tax=Phallusia mammillata TaxID=59560 RepID=A0A6F9DGA5_9ASCI|nr:calsenilin [Phallusia mammillata]